MKPQKARWGKDDPWIVTTLPFWFCTRGGWLTTAATSSSMDTTCAQQLVTPITWHGRDSSGLHLLVGKDQTRGISSLKNRYREPLGLESPGGQSATSSLHCKVELVARGRKTTTSGRWQKKNSQAFPSAPRVRTGATTKNFGPARSASEPSKIAPILYIRDPLEPLQSIMDSSKD